VVDIPQEPAEGHRVVDSLHTLEGTGGVPASCQGRLVVDHQDASRDSEDEEGYARENTEVAERTHEPLGECVPDTHVDCAVESRDKPRSEEHTSELQSRSDLVC